jgi:uncharacterized protein YjbI with pentapeptide repeats
MLSTIQSVNVTSVSSNAFYYDASLSHIVLSDSITQIGESAFQSCTGLSNVIIPANVTTIDTRAFASDSALASVYFLGAKPSSIGEWAFGDIKNPSTAYYLSTNASSWESQPDYITNLATFTISDLRIAGYTASELQTLGVADSDILGAGYSVVELLEIGFTAAQLRDYGVSATQFKDAGYSLAYIKNIGFTLIELLNNNTVQESVNFYYRDTWGDGWNGGSVTIKETSTNETVITLTVPSGSFGYSTGTLSPYTNYTITKIKGAYPDEAYYSITTLDDTIVLSEQQLSSSTLSSFTTPGFGYTPSQLLTILGYVPFELKNAGYSITDLQDAGYSNTDILGAGYTATQLQTAEYTITDLREALYSDSDILGAGYTALDLKNAGFTAAELKAAWVSLSDAEIATLLKEAGFTAAELKAAEFSASVLQDAGYSDTAILGAGYTATQLQSAGYTIADLLSAGYSESDILGAGYNATDLAAAGFYQISGRATGLSMGATFVLTLFIDGVSVETKTIQATSVGNNSFYFSNYVSDGSTYDVTITTQPDGKTGTITNGSGTINGSHINNISIEFTDNNTPAPTYTVGGTFTGVATGTSCSLELSVDGISVETLQKVSVNADAQSFVFTTPVSNGSDYSVSATSSGKTATITNGSGTIDGANVTNISIEFTDNNTPTIPTSNVCFPAKTPIMTNQGPVNIEDIDPAVHTIRNKKIVAITKTVAHDKNLVRIAKHALGHLYPEKTTFISQNHKVFFQGQMVKAKHLVDDCNVTNVPYNGQVLYNVLLAEHEKMQVNNLIVETLHPEHKVAKLYRILKNVDAAHHGKMIALFNKCDKEHRNHL